MRIGVISDTHNNLKNVARIVDLMNDSGVAAIVHTGDITQAKTLDVLAKLNAPMVGVFGNNDIGEKEALETAMLNHGFDFRDPPFEFTWHNRRIIVVHDPLEFDGHLNSSHDVALHGHTHRHRFEHVNSTLVFNPGECAGMISGLNAVGVLDLESLTSELLRF